MTENCFETGCVSVSARIAYQLLFHNIPTPQVARFLGFIQGFHVKIVDI